MNWLDPEPESGSSDYEKYIKELQHIGEAKLYKGFSEPPTEEEYTRLIEDIGGVASRTRARRLAGGRI